MSSIFRLSCLVLALTGLQAVMNVASAQADDALWQAYNPPSLKLSHKSLSDPVDIKHYIPETSGTFRLAEGLLKEQLTQAPVERGAAHRASRQHVNKTPLTLSIPLPEGEKIELRFEESPIMEPALADQYPEIKTYRAYVIDNPSIQGRADLTPQGFHIMLSMDDGRTLFIDPRNINGERIYISYYKKDYRPAGKSQARCLVEEHQHKSFSPLLSKSAASLQTAARAGTDLRHYRLALAATAEYTAFHGGSSQAMAAMTTTINRVNQIYERDVSIRLNLIANTNLLIYTDANTDPYSNFDGDRMLDENQTNIDQVIGNSNYDIGHVFSTGGGGIAFLGNVCTSRNKAGGVTGLANPVNDTFDIDFVAHEIGHQFAASHTFNNCAGSSQRTSFTAFEPGSGSTIMGYAGICGSNYNLQSNSDAMFHAGSISQILDFSERTPGTMVSGGACYTQNTLNNAIPTVSAGADYTIPARTPFTLTANASDADGNSLTYAWEQFDAGTESEVAQDLGDNALFRSFMPVASPSRTFPKLEAVLNNSTSFGETLPTSSRAMNFSVTVRDNQGAVHADLATLQVVDTGSAFQITSPNNSFSTNQGQQLAVQWDVAGTNGSQIACSAVNIALSRNGGQSFEATLSHKTPNDGNEVVYLPYGLSASNQARLKVSCADNIFFDISNQNFTFNTRSGENNLPVTASAGTSSARISGYVFNTSNATKSVGNNFSRNQAIHVLMELSPDASDVGRSADIYMVANYNNQWFMRNTTGNWQTWSVESGLAALVPAENRTLTTSESLTVALNVQNLPGDFLVHVGYRNAQGAVVYNSQALSFRVN